MGTQHSRDGGPEPPSRSEEDRVVSRRVDNPTRAAEEDERTYSAAGSRDADDSPATQPADPDESTTERVGRNLAAEQESEPTRSE